jgi:hypothetical protein
LSFYPASYRGGMALGRKNWMLGVEGGYTETPPAWRWLGFWPAEGKPSWDVRFGLEWLPAPGAPAFYKRLRYQIGAYLQTFSLCPHSPLGRYFRHRLGLPPKRLRLLPRRRIRKLPQHPHPGALLANQPRPRLPRTVVHPP